MFVHLFNGVFLITHSKLMVALPTMANDISLVGFNWCLNKRESASSSLHGRKRRKVAVYDALSSSSKKSIIICNAGNGINFEISFGWEEKGVRSRAGSKEGSKGREEEWRREGEKKNAITVGIERDRDNDKEKHGRREIEISVGIERER